MHLVPLEAAPSRPFDVARALASPLLNASLQEGLMISYSQGDRGGACVRRVWSRLRWALVGAGLPLIWACGDHPLVAPTPDPSRVVDRVFPASLVNKLDVL